MKQLLITGFDPFGGTSVNPSWEAVCLLPETIGSFRLTKLQLPTIFEEAAQQVLTAAHKLQPDVILCLGLAGGRRTVTPELVAINLRDARIPDNAGNQPINCPVVDGGPAAYFATVPVRGMVKAVQSAGIPCSISYSAGAYVCNDVFYTLLHHFNGTATKVGFIHIPALPEQSAECRPSMCLDQIVRALTTAIEVL